MIFHTQIALVTRGHTDIHDITPQVEQSLRQSGIQQGLLTIFTPSATSALTTIEFESGALQDLRDALDTIAPPNAEYQHNLRWGDGNGHSHLRAALLGPSISVPILQGRLTLGTWQQLIFLDFDVRARDRKLECQIIGDVVEP